MTLAAVSDTGPLSHLDEINSLDLLCSFDQLYVPGIVYSELTGGGVPNRMADLRHDFVEAYEEHVESRS